MKTSGVRAMIQIARSINILVRAVSSIGASHG
jgi:hypothetical protein